MLRHSKSDLKKNLLRVTNPREAALTVWLEPWGERFGLPPGASLDVVFVGPKVGYPEVVMERDSAVVQSWDSSEAMVFRDGRVTSRIPLVAEIVSQEFEIARLPREQIFEDARIQEEFEFLQRSLDAVPTFDGEAQQMACNVAASIAPKLAALMPSRENVNGPLWQIVDRIVATRALALAYIDDQTQRAAIRDELRLSELIVANAVSLLPDSELDIQFATPTPPARHRTRRP